MAKTVQIRGRKFLPCHCLTPADVAAIKQADAKRRVLFQTLRKLGARNLPRPKKFAKGL
jgi:hypothetical protein